MSPLAPEFLATLATIAGLGGVISWLAYTAILWLLPDDLDEEDVSSTLQ